MASESSLRSKLCVIVLEPRHKVDNKLIVVEMEAAVLPMSGPAAPDAAAPALAEEPPGVVPGLGRPEPLEEVFKVLLSPDFLPPEALESL